VTPVGLAAVVAGLVAVVVGAAFAGAGLAAKRNEIIHNRRLGDCIGDTVVLL
jgi:hypothetical protein